MLKKIKQYFIQNKVNYIIFFIIIVFAWTLDFYSKLLAIWHLKGVPPLSFMWKDLLRFNYTLNRGGVFGLAQGYTFLFHILNGFGILTLFIFFYIVENKTRLFYVSVGFLLGGALGNFTDRFFREGVVDFIEMGLEQLRYPFIYNVADVFVFIGLFLLLKVIWNDSRTTDTKAK